MTQDSMTTILAVWGACLGTIGTIISVILVVREVRKDRHQIKISTDVSNYDPLWIISGMETKTYILVSILNTGFRPTQVKTVMLVLSDGKTIAGGRLIKDELPQILAESQSVDVYFDQSEIRKAKSSKEVFLRSVLVSDSAGNTWKSNIPKAVRQMI